MKASLIKLLLDVRASYWFIPAMMVVGSIALSILMYHVDTELGVAWLRDFPYLYSATADGARTTLSAIAGSMIGVAGVTFSMTIVSMSFAAAQFGPRLVGNFMRDRGNQLTLGTFISTFVYCLVVLRTVRNAEDGDDAQLLVAFVPHMSLLVAFALALASVAVLIYFIHHIPETLNVSNMTASVGRQLREDLKVLFPENNELSTGPTTGLTSEYALDQGEPVPAERSGYVQAIQLSGILEVANEHDLVVRLARRPGDFAAQGEDLARVFGSPSRPLPPEIERAIREAYALGDSRTAYQNVLFLVDQLVEIMARALSPGVNDPFTAMACTDWLCVGLIAAARQREQSECQYGGDDKLRVITRPVDFERLCGAIFGQTLQYVAADRNACMHMLEAIGRVARSALPSNRETLLQHAQQLTAAAEERLAHKSQVAQVQQAFSAVERLCSAD